MNINDPTLPVVFDALGADAYAGNLRALAPRGWFVNYGHAHDVNWLP